MSRPKAMVTGASRGIGKATAVALAAAGFDVAVAARTRHEGEGRNESGQGSLPGSIDATCSLVTEAGGAALAVHLDLLDAASIADAIAQVADWGGVEVLVNNAVHTGPGSMTQVLDITPELLRTKFEANVAAQVAITQGVLPAMLDRGHGTIVNLTSATATSDPAMPAGEGGWGFAYAMSKGAFHRLTGMLHVELGPKGIVAFNVDPGYVYTEVMAANARDHGLEGHYRAAPPSVPAAAIAWLVTDPEARALSGTTIRAQKLALERDLHPDWRTECP